MSDSFIKRPDVTLEDNVQAKISQAADLLRDSKSNPLLVLEAETILLRLLHDNRHPTV